MKWRSFIHQGNEYDLSHLDPFEWKYTAAAAEKRPECTFNFHVTFSSHCFTRGPLPGEVVDDSLRYMYPLEDRLFCFDRHEASYFLPDIIRGLGERPCYHTRHGNYFTIELMSKEGKPSEYEIYFDVTRASRRGWLNLVVQSAYIRTEEYASTQPIKRKIRLGVIAHNVQRKKMVRPGR